VSAVRILNRQAVVFLHDLAGVMGAAGMGDLKTPRKDQILEAGDLLFNETADVERVDIFISHTWKAGRWDKYMGLCLYLNLGIAVKCSFAAWAISLAILACWAGPEGLGGNRVLFVILVHFPMAVFFAVFFFGQRLSCGYYSPSMWLDKLCVHQTNAELKERQIGALPVFVAGSSRMLVLWDSTYFERLWCSLELATFAKHGDPKNLDILPLWLAPWLLSSLLMELLSVTLLELSYWLFPNWSTWKVADFEAFYSMIFGGSSSDAVTFCVMASIWMVVEVCFLPGLIPSFFSFRMKIQNHRNLLEQVAAFDVRAAKCTVAEDRLRVEQQVEELFREVEDMPAEMTINVDADSDGHDDPITARRDSGALDRFNDYVRGPLHDAVLEQMGTELYMPWRTCAVASMPMIFFSTVHVLGCENGPCQSSADENGFASVESYMLTSTTAWMLYLPLICPLEYPTLLRMMRLVMSLGDGPLSRVLAALCLPLSQAYTQLCGAFIWASVYLLAFKSSPIRLCWFLLYLILLVLQLIWLFRRRRAESHSCRGIQREEAFQSSSCPDQEESLLGETCIF